MKKQTLKELYAVFLEAGYPEDVFGEIAGEKIEQKLKALQIKYHGFTQVVHPDKNPNDKDMSVEAFKALGDLYERAQIAVKENKYGQRVAATKGDEEDSFVIITPKREYVIHAPLCTGDIAKIWSGEVAGTTDLESKIVLKVTKDIDDNDLAQNEIRVLRMFQAEMSKQSKHLPFLLDTCKTFDEQICLVLRYFDGVDLHEVHKKYPQGVPLRHAFWMMQRALSVLGYVHSQGVIHGNIIPAHLMVRGRDHNLIMVDWSYAIINPKVTGDGFKVLNEEFSPPEVARKEAPLPSSDIYSLGKCFMYLLGGDIKRNTMPDTVPQKLQNFVKAMVLTSPLQRPRDAWDLYGVLQEVRKEVLGPTKFELFV